MTHLMARGGTLGRRGPQRDALRIGQGSQRIRRAAARHRRPGCLDRPLRCGPLAVRQTPRHEPRLTSGQGNPVKWVIINVP